MGGKYMFYKYRTASKVSQKVPVRLLQQVLERLFEKWYIAVSIFPSGLDVACTVKQLLCAQCLSSVCIFAVNISGWKNNLNYEGQHCFDVSQYLLSGTKYFRYQNSAEIIQFTKFASHCIKSMLYMQHWEINNKQRKLLLIYQFLYHFRISVPHDG